MRWLINRSEVVQHVVRHRGRWYLAPLPGSDLRGPRLVDLDEVLRMLAPDGASDATAGAAGSDSDAPAAEMAVAPVWCWAARIVQGTVLLEHSDGSPLVLGHQDLRLIDAVDAPLPVHEVAARLGRSAHEVLDHALSLGSGVLSVAADLHDCVHFEPRPAFCSAPAYEDEPEPAPPPTVPAPTVTSTTTPATGGRTTSGRVPVYAIWHDRVGPSLSLGLLTATARAHGGGSLEQTFDIRRPEHVSSFLADLAGRTGPAVLLCSDYVWSLEDNLAAATAGRAIAPELLVVHGGPSSPKYDADARRFLSEHAGAAQLLVRGEGELVLARVLESFAQHGVRLHRRSLEDIGGLSFIDPESGEFVRTPDQERIADLDALPSPYLTGEFDDIDPAAWQHCLSVETNRGCPYGCTFCDWGSSTLSRIRRFDLERVRAELEWVASRGVASLNITDANFGILARDVQIAEMLADVRRRYGTPGVVSYYPAKNTTKYLVPIMDVLLAAGVGPTATISLQTTDPATLEAIDRSNISTEHHLALAAEMRRRQLPLQGDLLTGLPGQTFASYKADLQHHLEHEISPRTWQVRVLPNAPMNAPEYRERFAIRTDDAHRVLSTSTFDRADRDRMLRLRTVEAIVERFGLLRHVLRYLQWDHGIAAMDVVERLLDLAERDPLRLPTLSWVTTWFDHFQVPAVGWPSFYDEVRSFVVHDLGVPDDEVLACVLDLQCFLMPAPGRTFPCTIDLAHDYPGWYLAATEELHRSGRAAVPDRRLADTPPGRLTVTGDPLALCTVGVDIVGDPRDPLFENDFAIGANSAYELASPLMRLLPHVAFTAMEQYRTAVAPRAPYEPPPQRRRIVVAPAE